MAGPLFPMARENIRIRHTHIPDVSIPDDDRSETESRAVAWRMNAGRSRVVVDVLTGDFSLHKDLAGQLTDRPGTTFGLPRSMPYETAVLIGLLTEEGQVSVFSTTDGFRQEARIGEAETYAILRSAAAGLARAIRRGYGLDSVEPSGVPYDMDLLPEPIMEEFDVTPEILEEFEGDVHDGVVILHEDVVPGTRVPPSPVAGEEEPPPGETPGTPC